MPKTPNYFYGTQYVNKLVLLSNSDEPTEIGEIVFSDGYFIFKNSYQSVNFNEIISSTSNINETNLQNSNQLANLINDGPVLNTLNLVKEIVGNPFPTAEIWKDGDNKVIELIITRDAQMKPIIEEWKRYEDGAIVEQITDTITYQGIFEISRTRVVNVS